MPRDRSFLLLRPVRSPGSGGSGGGLVRSVLLTAFVGLGAVSTLAGAERSSVNPGLGSAPLEVRRGSPRESLVGFLDACEAGRFDLAAHYLDLGELPASRQAAEGAALARRLMIGLLSGSRLDPERVSDDPPGVPEVDLPDTEERIVSVRRGFRKIDVLLVDRGEPERSHLWLFSRDTVARIDDLFLSRAARRLVDRVPAVWFTVGFAGLQLWQWVSVLAALLFGWFASRLAGRLIRRVARALARRTRATWDDVVAESLDGPAAFLAWVVLLALATPFFGLFPEAQTVAWRLLGVMGVLGLGWLAARLTDGFVEHVRRAAAQDANAVGAGFLPVVSRFVKVFLALLVVLSVLGVIGIDVAAGLAGLGLAGAAVAFAAQKTIENLFGATVIASDRPFKVGDFVAIGTDQGTVEDVGLRSTRLRTQARTVVSLPNGLVAAGRVENFAARDRYLFNPTIGLVYSTRAPQLRAVVEGLGALLAAHPAVHPEGRRVRFRGFGESALEVEILAWLTAGDLAESLRIAEELNFSILDLVERCGSSFAFPSRTVYLERQGDATGESGAALTAPGALP